MLLSTQTISQPLDFNIGLDQIESICRRFPVNSYLSQLVPILVNSYQPKSTCTYFGQLEPVLVNCTLCKKRGGLNRYITR